MHALFAMRHSRIARLLAAPGPHPCPCRIHSRRLPLTLWSPNHAQVEFVFALTGATACALLSWVLPAAIYLALHGPRGSAAALPHAAPQQPDGGAGGGAGAGLGLGPGLGGGAQPAGTSVPWVRGRRCIQSLTCTRACRCLV